MNEKSKGIWNPVWPGPRAALLRLLFITILLLPLEWVVFALLVGDWSLNISEGTEESARHLREGALVLVAAVGILFLTSLLPVSGKLSRLFRRMLSPRVARRIMMSLIWLMTVVLLFYAEEDWRGARAWRKYRQDLEAGGAQLDLAAFIPNPVPDAQNFAAAPLIKSWFVEANPNASGNATERYAKNWRDNYAQVPEKLSTPKEASDRHFLDLVAWGKVFDAIRAGQTNLNQELDSGRPDLESRRAAVPAVLAGLKTNESVLAELGVASQRPLARYPVVYNLDNPWGIYLPHLANLRDACRRLQLRACAELAAGRSENALADVKLMLGLADSIKGEPFLISYLVRLACVQTAIQPVWEGLAEQAWTDAQLQEMQSRFQKYDFVADMKWPFEGERAAGVLSSDLMRKKGLGLLIEIIGPGSPTSMDKKFANWWGEFIPHGWYDLEQLNYCRLYQVQIQDAFDPARKRISPAQTTTNAHELQRQLASGNLGKALNILLHHRFIAALMLPSLDKIPLKAAISQTAADQAALACALERFRLANGQYPDKLDALAPKFISQLPGDPLTGESYKYRRSDGGQFKLYSVGWNEKDDGGVPGKKMFDEKQGDWVWQYPEK